MATTIPDKLKNLVCDYCHKYLSVTPVRMFPDKQIRCGRCLNDDDDDGGDYFELLVNEYCFPCVNRFDGCEQLLVPSEVAVHEKSCQSGRNPCPICEDKEIPTFLMIKHFQDKHIENLLQTNKFSIDPKESLATDKWFLYELKNRLFFINCSLNKLFISLNITHLGISKESERIFQRFSLKNKNRNTFTIEKPCLPHKTNDVRSTVAKLTFDPKTPIDVNFEIHFFSSEMAVTKQSRYDAMLVLGQKSTLIGKRSGQIRKNASLTEVDFPEDDLIKSRYVFLGDCRDKTLSIGSTFDYCIQYRRKIFLRCFVCAELADTTDSWTDDVVIFSGTAEEAYLICSMCKRHPKTLKLPDKKYMRFSYFKTIKFFCIWNCDMTIPIDKVLAHEFACEKQPSRLCPLESCSMKGKLDEIEEHFDEVHFPEYRLTYESFIYIGLDPLELPIKYFLLVRNAFVFVELTWTRPLWNMKFRLCGKKETFAGMKLKAMVEDKGRILNLAEYPQPIQFYHMNEVRIKCYLEK